MWLYVPLAASPASAVSISDCTLRPEVESCVTWSGKPIRPQSWRNACKTALSMRRLSGLTSPPLTLQRGVDAWISSLADSRARTSAWPGLGPASKANDLDSGQSSAVSIASLTPDGCSLRTSQPSLFGDSSESSVTLPRSGALRNGCVYERPTWAPRTGAIDGSYLRNEYPTPSATPYGGNKGGANPDGPERPSIETMAKLWPTATATDAKASGADGYSTDSGRHSETTLTDASRLWQTPRHEGFAAGGHNGRADSLHAQCKLWATPMSRDYRSGQVSEQTAAKNTRPLSEQVLGHQGQTVIGDTSRRTSTRRLNPAFVSWLMGMPWWWTQPAAISSARSAMASYLCRQRSLLRSFVPGWVSGEID